MKQPAWTLERLRSISKKEIETLRANALRVGVRELADLCTAALDELKPKARATREKRSPAGRGYVTEYHFVCREDRGVTVSADGTFRSASWVVALNEVEKSLRFGARFALHNSKQEPSYRQGQIVGFEPIENFEDGETTSRIDFIVRPDEQIMEWAGKGAGEKGYLWSSEVSGSADE